MSIQARPPAKGEEGYRLSPSEQSAVYKGQQIEMELDFSNKIYNDKDLMQITCLKSRFKKAIIGVGALLIVIGLLISNKKQIKQPQIEIEKPKSRFPKTHQFHDVNFKDDGHLPSFQHLHTPLNFSYPTVGIPIPGKYFNATRVPEKDLKQFDQVILDLFKPYNVILNI